MFTELKIKNFQSLKNVSIKLGHVTVIIGPSYLGKSAVVRALYTLVHNRFESSFMRKGAQSTSVELWEGDKYVRFLRGSNSSYKFSEIAEDYTKIGREVPAEIKEFINMDEVSFDDFSLDFNIQRQFDRDFLISLSGFEVAKVFGKMMNLEIVLAATKDISKDVQALNRKKDAQNAIIDVSIEYIQEHYSVQLKNALLKEALEIDSEAEKLAKEADELYNLICTIEQVQAEFDQLKKLGDFLDSQNIDLFEEPPKMLENLIVSLEYCESQIDAFSKVEFEAIQDFDFAHFRNLQTVLVDSEFLNKSYSVFFKLFKSLEEIDTGDVDSLVEFNSIISCGDKINMDYKAAAESYLAIKKATEQKQKDFDEYIVQNNICPISQQPFTAECIQAIKQGGV